MGFHSLCIIKNNWAYLTSLYVIYCYKFVLQSNGNLVNSSRRKKWLWGFADTAVRLSYQHVPRTKAVAQEDGQENFQEDGKWVGTNKALWNVTAINESV